MLERQENGFYRRASRRNASLLLVIYLGVQFLSQMVTRVEPLEVLLDGFPKWSHHFTFPLALRVPSPHLLSILAIVWLFDCIRPGECEVICGFGLHFSSN